MCEDGEVVVHDESAADALIAAGGVLARHAHQMRLPLPLPPFEHPEFRPFNPDGTPPVPWTDALTAFIAAYPPEHPDHLTGDGSLIDSYLVPYTSGAKLGPLICHASAIAVHDDYAYAGVLIVDRPGEGPWVCDIWRDPDPAYAGTGSDLLRWSASRLDGFAELGLVVTAGNTRAQRAYERVGFTVESTAWRFRMP